jgi:hypothetical protein
VCADDPELVRIAEAHADGLSPQTEFEREVFAALDRVCAALAAWGVTTGVRRK